jgi:hypothetical protein
MRLGRSGWDLAHEVDVAVLLVVGELQRAGPDPRLDGELPGGGDVEGVGVGDLEVARGAVEDGGAVPVGELHRARDAAEGALVAVAGAVGLRAGRRVGQPPVGGRFVREDQLVVGAQPALLCGGGPRDGYGR